MFRASVLSASKRVLALQSFESPFWLPLNMLEACRGSESEFSLAQSVLVAGKCSESPL